MELTIESVAERAESQPGDRAPAPGDLGLVQAFVNSFYDLDNHGGDLFQTPESLGRWLLKWDLADAGVRLGPADVHRAVDVREGLRALLFINNGSEADTGAIWRLNRALRGPGAWVQFEPGSDPTSGPGARVSNRRWRWSRRSSRWRSSTGDGRG